MLPAMSSSRRLPTGTLTLLFTDIEGSTHLVQSLGAARYAAFAAHGGHEVDTQGDAFFAVFSHATAAVAAAIDAQRALASHPWPDDGAVRVRMGLHTGELVITAEGYVGVALNRGARICAVAHGAQIFLSSTCRQVLSASDHPPDWTFRDLGEHRLRDIRHTEHLFQVFAPGMPDVATRPAVPNERHAGNRVLVRESSEIHALPEAMRLLLDAIRSDSADRTVTLSPTELQGVVAHPAVDLTTFCLGRVAEWSLPRYQLDDRFVELRLLVDQGEQSAAGRWRAKEARYANLGELLSKVPSTALVLLGAPGSGKSTLLRRFELDCAVKLLREDDSRGPITLFLPLNEFGTGVRGHGPPAPMDWLTERWRTRYIALPGLETLLAAGRMVLLLDGLNEMPRANEDEYWERVQLWKRFVQQVDREAPGNRILFTCRTLDYSEPLSSKALRVPHIHIEPLSDTQVQAFLRAYIPNDWERVWNFFRATPQLDLLRLPFNLKLLIDQMESGGTIPKGRVDLFTGFIRESMKREVEAGHPALSPGHVLTRHDHLRLAWARAWRSPHDLPDHGPLITGLEALAYAMQERGTPGEASQVRVDYRTACRLVAHDRADEILAAGIALGMLDKDFDGDEILFSHQLLQEYFAARKLAKAPDPDLVRAAWRGDAVSPSLRELIGMLPAAETLPPLPRSGWEETTTLAAAMAGQPEAFVRGIMDINLALAGYCAIEFGMRERLSEPFLDELRQALLDRSSAAHADLRARIEAGLALGHLGDPRFKREGGPHGDYLMPPLIEVPAGAYWMGTDDGPDDERPRHRVELAAFSLGRFPVTNAEWACFVDAGGYDEQRWWDTDEARAWQCGRGTYSAVRSSVRDNRQAFLRTPNELEQAYQRGRLSSEQHERWRHRLSMDDDEFETYLQDLYPDIVLREPRLWRDPAFNNPAQPVVGVCWFEVRAYCNWLAATSHVEFRLPTEAEWEAAARGMEGRLFAHGTEYDPLKANVLETRWRRTTPIGVFQENGSPQGFSDLTGNVWEWTSSLWGSDPNAPEFRYPYRNDGRENPATRSDVLCILRGGAFLNLPSEVRCTYREATLRDNRNETTGFRLAWSPAQDAITITGRNSSM